MATDQDILDFLRSLFTDSGTANQLATDPARAFADHGVADATPDQLNQCVSALATTPGALPPSVQARLEAAIGSPGGTFSAAGYQGNAPMVLAQASPVVAGYSQTMATILAASEPPSITQQLTNVTNVDNSTRITDNSLHQQLINLGGTLTNTVATGGGVAAGPDAHVNVAGDGSIVAGDGATVDNALLANAPITHSTLTAGDLNGSVSGQDTVLGSGNMTDADGTGANVGGVNVGSTSEVANKDGILAHDSPVNAGSPGAAAASGGSQAATGGGAPGAGGGSVDGGGDTLQVGGQNVAGSEGVNLAGPGGDANQINQGQTANAFGSGAGGEGGPVAGNEGTQLASITPDGGGPIYVDQSEPSGGYQPDDPGMSQPPDPTVSDQPAGMEHTDPLG
jgi:hypothetical protein